MFNQRSKIATFFEPVLSNMSLKPPSSFFFYDTVLSNCLLNLNSVRFILEFLILLFSIYFFTYAALLKEEFFRYSMFWFSRARSFMPCSYHEAATAWSLTLICFLRSSSIYFCSSSDLSMACFMFSSFSFWACSFSLSYFSRFSMYSAILVSSTYFFNASFCTTFYSKALALLPMNCLILPKAAVRSRSALSNYAAY